jgi:hypothetical protein
MCCNLYDPIHEQPATSAPLTALAGTLVSSLHRLKDIDNSGSYGLYSIPQLLEEMPDPYNLEGGFFVFGDLSVKREGEYRLWFSLYEMLKYYSQI